MEQKSRKSGHDASLISKTFASCPRHETSARRLLRTKKTQQGAREADELPAL